MVRDDEASRKLTASLERENEREREREREKRERERGRERERERGGLNNNGGICKLNVHPQLLQRL
jgi:hypothetical protein